MEKTLVLEPRISEKAYGLSEARNTYVFNVPKKANKQLIADAVQAQFNVTVEAVNTVLVKGKRKRTVRKGGRPVMGKQNDVKKAYVRLKAGDSIAIFQTEEDDTKSDKKERK